MKKPLFSLSAKRWHALFVALGAVFFAFAPGSQAGSFSDWAVVSHQGKAIHSSALGRVTILNFWATYCIPCMIEIPTFHALVDKYEKKGLTVVGVSVDARTQSMLKAFIDKFKMNYPVALANAGIMSNFGVSDRVPMTFVLDQHGKIINSYTGYVKKEDLEKDIRPLLNL